MKIETKKTETRELEIRSSIYHQFILKYRKAGMKIWKQLVFIAVRYQDATPNEKALAIRKAVDLGEEGDRIIACLKAKDFDSLWIINDLLNNDCCNPLLGTFKDVENWIQVRSESILTEMKSGERDWFTQKVKRESSDDETFD